MCDYIYSSIVSHKVPPIVQLAFAQGDGWYYDISGHAVSLYGVLNDKSGFAIADPMIAYKPEYRSKYSSYYEKSATSLYNTYYSKGNLMY